MRPSAVHVGTVDWTVLTADTGSFHGLYSYVELRALRGSGQVL